MMILTTFLGLHFIFNYSLISAYYLALLRMEIRSYYNIFQKTFCGGKPFTYLAFLENTSTLPFLKGKWNLCSIPLVPLINTEI